MNEPTRLADRLIEATRVGPAREWVDRLEKIAADAGIRTELIAWGGAPMDVAWGIAAHAFRQRSTEALEASIVKAEASNPVQPKAAS